MPPLVPVNAEFEQTLTTYAAAPGLVAGLRAALGVAPGAAVSAEEYPLLGFWLTADANQLLAYFVTPGRFIRYEVADGQALTVTVPIERIRRVVEHAGPAAVSVTVELDADAAVSVTEAGIRPDPDSMDDDRVARAVTRTNPTTYQLGAQAADADGEAALARLVTFSRALRLALGI